MSEGNNDNTRQHVAPADYNQAEASDSALMQPEDFLRVRLFGVKIRNAITVPERHGANPPHPVDSDVAINPEGCTYHDLDNLPRAVGWLHDEKKIDDTSDPDGNHVMTRNEIKVYIMLQQSSQAPAIKYTVPLSTNVPVLQLKKSQEHKLDVPHAHQRWLFKNTELDNNDTLGGSSVRANDYIHVQIEKQDHMALL